MILFLLIVVMSEAYTFYHAMIFPYCYGSGTGIKYIGQEYTAHAVTVAHDTDLSNNGAELGTMVMQ